MLNLPTPPTDNLYKFISIFGLVISVLAFIYVETKSLENLQEIYQLNTEKKQLVIEKGKLKRQTESIKDRLSDFDKKANSKSPSVINDSVIIWTKVIDGPKDLIDESKSITQLIEDLRIAELDYLQKETEIEDKQSIIDIKTTQNEKVFDWIDIILPFGVLLTIVGFKLWYNKSQKYQDIILKEQFLKAKRNEHCQSCGIPLNRDLIFSEKSEDEKRNTKYCSHCFKDGQFIDPEMTITKMKNEIDKRCKELGLSRFQAYLWKADLENLDRWQKRFYWKKNDGS